MKRQGIHLCIALLLITTSSLFSQRVAIRAGHLINPATSTVADNQIILVENKKMIHLFESMGFDIQKRVESGVYELKMAFRSK